jgi:hypothetical protein
LLAKGSKKLKTKIGTKYANVQINDKKDTLDFTNMETATVQHETQKILKICVNNHTKKTPSIVPNSAKKLPKIITESHRSINIAKLTEKTIKTLDT